MGDSSLTDFGPEPFAGEQMEVEVRPRFYQGVQGRDRLSEFLRFVGDANEN